MARALQIAEKKIRLNDTQKVNSAYTKNNPAGFVTGSDVLYADKKRTIPLLRRFGLAITSRQLLQNGSMGSITYDGDRVKMPAVTPRELPGPWWKAPSQRTILYREYKSLREYLKGTKLTISETDAADLLDYNDLRKRNFGRVTIAKGQTNVDQVYQELAGRRPEFFDDQQQTHPGDQLERIFDVLGEVYRIGGTNPYAASMEEAVTGADNEILETFFDLPQTRKTFADRQARKLDDADGGGK